MAPTKLGASVDVIRQQVLVLGTPADQPTAFLQVHQHRGSGLATAVLGHVFQGVGADIEQGNHVTDGGSGRQLAQASLPAGFKLWSVTRDAVAGVYTREDGDESVRVLRLRRR